MKIDNISILHLEDNKLDFEHINAIIKKEFNSVDISWTDNKKDFINNLKHKKFDIILADYSLPGFNGLEALEIATSLKPEIPFVFVSGAIGEDLAIESLKAGAKDYVVKDGYKRLTAAIKRAIIEVKEISKRKKAEKALTKSENRLKMIFQTSPVGIINLDNNGNFIDVNNAFCEMLGYTADELLKMNISTILPDQRENLNEYLKNLMEKEKISIELTGVKKDGSIIPVQAAIWILEKNKVSGIRIASVIKDLTEHKELEDQKILHESMKNQLERVTSLSHLSSAITHEIKQPLQSIKVIADSILYLNSKDKKLDYSEIIEDVSNISERVDRINNIINSIKVLINAPEKLNVKEINIDKQIDEVLKFYGEKLYSHGITLLYDKSNKYLAIASELQLQQVIINLLENAVSALDKIDKDDKKIIISMKQDESHLLINISDNGTGIDDKFKNKIFDAFFSLSNKVERMGMGLFIVSNIIKCFNGTLNVLDNEMGGATFVIRLKKKMEQ